MAHERDGAATVISQEGDRIQVQHRGETLTVSMGGFPDGFKLNPGSRVILADEPSGNLDLAQAGRLAGLMTPDKLQAIIASVPMGRPGHAHEVAGCALFPACDQLSSYVTGSEIDINGGSHIH